MTLLDGHIKLTLETSTLSDAGEYTIKIADQSGRLIQNSATVVVQSQQHLNCISDNKTELNLENENELSRKNVEEMEVLDPVLETGDLHREASLELEQIDEGSFQSTSVDVINSEDTDECDESKRSSVASESVTDASVAEGLWLVAVMHACAVSVLSAAVFNKTLRVSTTSDLQYFANDF